MEIIEYTIQIIGESLDVSCGWVGILQMYDPEYSSKYVWVFVNELFIAVATAIEVENDDEWSIKELDTSRKPSYTQNR